MTLSSTPGKASRSRTNRRQPVRLRTVGRLELVTRRGCHLCEEVETELARLGVAAELLDVDADPELSRLYDFRVPVLLVDGRVAAEGRISADRLVAVLGISQA